jgi:glycine oxidase
MPQTSDPSTTYPDLLVVGGGVIGLGLAWEAARRGVRVTLLDKGPTGREASWAGAGMIQARPWPKPKPGKPDYQDLALACFPLYEAWAARLLDETGVDIELLNCGGLELIPASEWDTPAGQDTRERLLRGGAERGVAVTLVGPEAVRQLAPALEVSHLGGALHIPQDKQVRTPRLLQALRLACVKAGVEIHERREIQDLWVELERVRGVLLANGDRLEAPLVAICAGAWTGRFPTLTTYVSRAQKIRPVRGQILAYQTEPGFLTPIVASSNGYFVPRQDGMLLIGSTSEDAGFDASTTPEGLAGLQAYAERWLPGLRALEPVHAWAGLRPGLSGNHPLLGPVPGLAGLYLAAGHFRTGLQLAPITARLLVQCIVKEPLEIPLDPWLPKTPEPRPEDA